MKLGARMLDPNSSLNNLKYMNQITIALGSTAVILFQLVDLDSTQEANRIGNRYMPASGASLVINIVSVNDANSLQKSCSQPLSDDKSIWQFSLTDAETEIMSGTNMKLTLTEGIKITVGSAKQVLIIDPTSSSQC
jgi:hypothetical protein